MKKFLVIQTAFIGDAVLASGLLEKLHQVFPDAEIDYMVRKGNEGLFAAHPYLHEVLVWDKKKSKYKHLLQLLSVIRKRKYDKVINVQRYAATGFITAFSGAKETIGFDKNPLSFLFTRKIKHVQEGLHEIERNHQLISFFTDAVAGKPRLYPSAKDMEFVAEYKKSAPYICIAPASVWFTKQFPKEKWVSFLNELPAGYPVFLIGAPTDADLCTGIQQNTTHPNVTNLAGKLNFLQSAALQKDAVMNYVNDSAPMHFASSVNAPIAAVYCSTIPAFGYGPLSDNSTIIEVEEKLDCRPCGIHGHKACPQGHFKCALDIKNEQLLGCLEGSS
ncbi:glycosyltransferase family 9 protein [Chitinophagaceae bacterium LWZ2-11]